MFHKAISFTCEENSYICVKCDIFVIHMLNAIFISNQARMLLRSLLIIGACTGLVLGTIGTSVPWFLPYAFTSDHAVVGEVVFHFLLLNFFSPFTKYQSHLVSYFREKTVWFY